MGYVDFVWFILSEEDKGNDVSLEYWFKCVDLDDDGFLRSNEMLVGMHCAKYSAPRPATTPQAGNARVAFDSCQDSCRGLGSGGMLAKGKIRPSLVGFSRCLMPCLGAGGSS